MEWPFNYHSKGRPRTLFRRQHLRSLLLSGILLGFLLDAGARVQGDSSPPVADVEDLFKGNNHKPLEKCLMDPMIRTLLNPIKLFGSVYASSGKGIFSKDASASRSLSDSDADGTGKCQI